MTTSLINLQVLRFCAFMLILTDTISRPGEIALSTMYLKAEEADGLRDCMKWKVRSLSYSLMSC